MNMIGFLETYRMSIDVKIASTPLIVVKMISIAGRMAELHAKQAPDCVHELEAWGAIFDRTTRAKSCSGTSAATDIRAWRTRATGRVWR